MTKKNGDTSSVCRRVTATAATLSTVSASRHVWHATTDTIGLSSLATTRLSLLVLTLLESQLNQRRTDRAHELHWTGQDWTGLDWRCLLLSLRTSPMNNCTRDKQTPPVSSHIATCYGCMYNYSMQFLCNKCTIIGTFLLGHSGPLCHALSLLSWTSMRRRRATVAACDSSDTW